VPFGAPFVARRFSPHQYASPSIHDSVYEPGTHSARQLRGGSVGSAGGDRHALFKNRCEDAAQS
jgi:hypothetical protein